jgi:Ca-activated chloride channel homolog
VSFGEPLTLLALLLLPLVAAWYLAEQRRRREAAAAFASPALQPSVAPRRPGWRRHAPLVVLGLALAALVLAAAKPQRTVAVPVERASIVLVVDVSASMRATDVRPRRLAAAERAARRFLDSVPAQVNVGLIAFNDAPLVLESPTRDREAVRAALGRLTASRGTATGEAIAAGVRSLRATRGRAPAAIVLLSDGTSTRGRDPLTAAEGARAARVPVHTVALGTRDGTITVTRRDGSSVTKAAPPDPGTLAEVARASGGKDYTAASSSRLDEVYERLGSQLGRRKEKREITSAFAAGGLVLLMTGMGFSLRWFGRLI